MRANPIRALEQRGIGRDEFMEFRGKWKGFWDSEMQSTYNLVSESVMIGKRKSNC